ncbi:MAG: glycosyltransferase [Corynebacterium sp.]|uniref:glycosyltransferase family protein n=1 Tax=Corynebacterium sp. TaxID=1720 RepID=UPI0026DB3E62|nr:glycosyltransferase [Corynebacterium sp.]MDO4760916.1 glycosyltransferase [Corynebacterium sp.]
MTITPTRVLMYSHDSQGLGHVRRNLALAHHIAQAIPNVSGLLLSGLTPTNLFTLPAGFDWVAVPGIAKGEGGYQARNLNEDTPHLIQLRSAIIASTLLSYQPDIVVIDRHIFGVWEELKEPLIALKQEHPHTHIVLGLREVLDSPEVARAEWDRLGDISLIHDLVDSIWVYGDRNIHDPIATGEIPVELADKIKYTGYLSTGRQIIDRKADIAPSPFILTTVGGGEDGFDLARIAVDMKVPAGHRHVIVAGPQLDDYRFQVLSRAAKMRRDVEVIKSWPGLASQIARATAVISMGGYNTTAEILATDTPAMIVPREVPRREQLIRARSLAAVGMVEYTRMQDLSSQVLGRWAARAVGKKINRAPIARHGLATVAQFALDCVRDARIEVLS